MKALKIVGIVLISLVVLVLAGGYIFLKTVDLNKYIPVVAEQVKKAVGRDLRIGRVALDISFRGLTLDASGISLSDDPGFSEKPFLSVDRVSLGLSLGPLIFERKIQIGEVTVVSPKIVSIRNKDGAINAAAMASSASAEAPEAQPEKKNGTAPAAALPAILVNRINVTGASVQYIDETFSPRIALDVNQVDFSISDFSLTKAFTYKLKAAVFSNSPDVEVNGQARIDAGSLSVWLTDGKATVNLAKISAEKVNSMLPMAAPAGLKDPLQGTLSVGIPELRAGSDGLKALKMTAELSGGVVNSSLIPVTVEDIAAVVEADAKDMTIKSVTLHVAEGTVTAEGSVRGYMSAPAVALTARANDVNVGKISEAYKLPVKVTGKAQADMTLTLAGKTPQEMTSSLKAEMTGSLKDGTLEGINLAQMGLSNIPMLPALWESVQTELPANTQEDLKKGITVIQSCDVAAQMAGMTATIERAELTTRDVVVSAKGTAQVPETLNLTVDLYIQKTLADALVRKVFDLEGLRVDQGRLYFPMTVSGPMMKPQAQPDVQYLSKKILVNRGKQEIGKILEKNPQAQGVFNALFGSSTTGDESSSEKTSTTGASSDSQTQETQSTATQAADAIFNSLFKKK